MIQYTTWQALKTLGDMQTHFRNMVITIGSIIVREVNFWSRDSVTDERYDLCSWCLHLALPCQFHLPYTAKCIKPSALPRRRKIISQVIIWGCQPKMPQIGIMQCSNPLSNKQAGSIHLETNRWCNYALIINKCQLVWTTQSICIPYILSSWT